jgi:hypothetical protein
MIDVSRHAPLFRACLRKIVKVRRHGQGAKGGGLSVSLQASRRVAGQPRFLLSRMRGAGWCVSFSSSGTATTPWASHP